MQLFLRNCNYLLRIVFILIINQQLHLSSAAIGVNYGLLGDNLPLPRDVINLYKKEAIPIVRLFDPNPNVLNALRGSGLRVSLGVRNEDVASIAMNVKTAKKWVKRNVVPYARDVNFGWITLGNEMVPGEPGAKFIPQAMSNIHRALHSVRLINIQVSTVISANVLGASYPPSAGSFSNEANALMREIVTWLLRTKNPLLINVYPYFAFASNPKDISLEYALFNAQQPVIDGQYKYYSLFEAMVDAFHAALEKIGGNGVRIVVSETGWPTAGSEPYANKINAQAYNQRLIDKMKRVGTPRRPRHIIDILIFAMFNENKKPLGVEQNWGIHYPNMVKIYPLTF